MQARHGSWLRAARLTSSRIRRSANGTRSLTEAPRRAFTGRRVINSNGLPASSAAQRQLGPLRLSMSIANEAHMEGAERDTLPDKGS